MKIELEREKERLSFRKFVLGSAFAAITLAAILFTFRRFDNRSSFIRWHSPGVCPGGCDIHGSDCHLI
jgi:hypothetical protein